MKKTLLIMSLILFGSSSTALAQTTSTTTTTARQLYLGYANNDKIANQDGGDKSKPNVGRPGAKVVIERMRDGKLSIVSPKSKFRSGDKIRLRFATNFDGYIKIINVGSSGKVSLLFPYEGADDRITPSNDFQLPKGGDWIVFDDTAGTETLTIIMSKKPLNFRSDEELLEMNKKATQSRDLTIESEQDATYAVCPEASLEKPIGFVLRLKHTK